ncbi:hypothetical protein QBC37DRAFT_377939 [Rhypophila decipiens]|uniref:Uncharacterized protein n=1 Tax=Rhypophila decipiens TaxID=261697 RepID=A0AAN7B4D3_9PEZI|nr:hypothetical protein QBC37DRAFT_377939 [Rhypophila decipiens]
MTPTRSSDRVEYTWPCGHYQNVKIEPAPAIPFAAVEFPIPLAKPVKHFTELEKGGIPALRKCCRCGDKYHLFRIPAECMGCSHSFRAPCTDCKIISVTGSREIATVEFKVTGDQDQTPKYWRCRLCDDINIFQAQDDEAGNALLEPRGLRCKSCSERFYESNWVISPFNARNQRGGLLHGNGKWTEKKTDSLDWKVWNLLQERHHIITSPGEDPANAQQNSSTDVANAPTVEVTITIIVDENPEQELLIQRIQNTCTDITSATGPI